MTRAPVSHEDIADRLDRGEEKFGQIMAVLAELRADMAALKESVRPLVDNTETLKGVAEVSRAASIWRKFLVGSLGLLVLIGAAGGVVTGIALAVKHWIIEGSAQ